MINVDKSAVFLILLGVFAVIQAERMNIGSFSQPGPGLFPFLSGILLSTLSVISLIRSNLKRVRKPSERMQRANLLKVFCVLAAVLLFRFLLPLLGYLLSSLVLLVVLIKVVGDRKWPQTVLWAAVFSGASYVLFSRWLMVQFPEGLLPF
jgi:putative tricarboxylic transport membrane protein